MTTLREHSGRPEPAGGCSPVIPLLGFASPARWSCRFTHGQASVTLRADRTELLTSAAATLYSYARTEAVASRWTIELYTDVLLDRVAAEALFASGAAQDIGPRLQARSITMPGGRAFWIRDRATLVQLDHVSGVITVHCGDLDAGVFFAARLVRQAMTAQLLEHDAVYAHAAALVHDGRGLVIAGPKGAGKTTTLLSALRLVGGDFVTNDRLLLRRDEGGGTVGYAWPMHLRATVDTLRAVPGMRRFLPREDDNTPAGPAAPVGKVAVEPDELRLVLPTVRILGEVRPALMVWPYRSSHDATPEPVSVAEVREVLVRTGFFMHDPTTKITSHRNHWLLPAEDAGRSAASLAAVVDLLAGTVPCVRVAVTDCTAALARHVSALLGQLQPATTVRPVASR